MHSKRITGIDLFAGAGGMSTGAAIAGIDIKLALEIDEHAANTFAYNHPNTKVVRDDIRKFKVIDYFTPSKNEVTVLFGGPPCQGFSTANQKTRTKDNTQNWLFTHFLRTARELKPDWVVVENVKGILETEGGFFLQEIIEKLNKLGYKTNYEVLNASDFGVPQMRNRVFIVGSKHGIDFKFPEHSLTKKVTVKQAIFDLPVLNNGDSIEELSYRTAASNKFQKSLRQFSKKALNNHVTNNNSLVLERYEYIPQGGNWEDIPRRLLKNYKDYTRCHTGIYYRLKEDEPSVVIGNYRKNMLIHPTQNRGLSVREAARLQSFPDTFRFFGSIGFQQQQVGNSVPPMLAKAIFSQITSY